MSISIWWTDIIQLVVTPIKYIESLSNCIAYTCVWLLPCFLKFNFQFFRIKIVRIFIIYTNIMYRYWYFFTFFNIPISVLCHENVTLSSLPRNREKSCIQKKSIYIPNLKVNNTRKFHIYFISIPYAHATAASSRNNKVQPTVTFCPSYFFLFYFILLERNDRKFIINNNKRDKIVQVINTNFSWLASTT